MRFQSSAFRLDALGFTPATLDPTMRTLDVRLAKDGLTARARKRSLATAPRS